MRTKNSYNKEKIDNIVNKSSVLEYFKFLENRDIVKFTRKSAGDFYFQTSDNKFSVSEKQNKYYDFITGKGGGIINAVMQIENKSWIEAIQRIEEIFNSNFKSEMKIELTSKNENIYDDKKEHEITSVNIPFNDKLIQYFENRGVSKEVLKENAKQISYKLKNKEYFGIGIENKSGGFEIRNPFIKTKLGPSNYSIIQNKKKDDIILVEGMTDAFSFLQLIKENGKQNNRTLIALNSIVNSKKFINDYSEYKGKIYLLLDADKGGNKTTLELIKAFPQAKDIRALYDIEVDKNNDLNDYLCNKLKLNSKNENRTKPTAISDTFKVGERTSNQNNNAISKSSQSEEKDNGERLDLGSHNVRNGFKNESEYNSGHRGISNQSIHGNKQKTQGGKSKKEHRNLERVPRLKSLISEISLTPTNDNIKKFISLTTKIDSDNKIQIIDPQFEFNQALLQYKPGGITKRGHGILNEYYTNTELVKTIGELISNHFNLNDNSKILEPSVGTGNFIHAIPEKFHKNINSFEINDVTAAIAKLRFPQVTVNLRNFESEFMGENGKKIQLPSEENKYDIVIGNPPYGKHRGFYKGLGEESKISRYEDYFIKRSLDVTKENGLIAMVLPSSWIKRQKELNNAELIEAYRLPSGVFKGTEVGTDIILLKKNNQILKNNISNYFEENYESVLGTYKTRTNQFGKLEDFVYGNLETALKILESIQEKKQEKQPQLSLFDSFENQPPRENTAERKTQNLNSSSKELADDITSQTDQAVTNSVENNEKRETLEKEEYLIQSEPKINKKNLKYQFKKNDSIVSLSDTNELPDRELESFKNTQYNGELKNPDDFKEYANYQNGKWIHNFYYQEGNIVNKLKQLEIDFSLKSSPISPEQYEKQKELLKSVLPVRKKIEEIIMSPNHELVHNLILGSKEIEYGHYGENKTEIVEFSLADKFKDFIRTLSYETFEGSSMYEVIGYVNNESVTGRDKERNALIRERRKEVANKLFSKFLLEELDNPTKELFVQEFNEKYNNTHVPDYTKFPSFSTIYENFKGIPLQLTSVQKAGIGQLTTKGVGLLAHEVGFGKTLSGILTLHEAMHRGNAKKPLIVVPNENILTQWVDTIYQTIPDAKVNVLGNLGKDYDLSNFKVKDGEISLVTYAGFNNVGFDHETTERLASRYTYISKNETKTLKNSERENEIDKSKEEELKGTMLKGKIYDWQDFDFDHLTFDEVHNANHIIAKVNIEDRRFSSDFRNQSQRTSQLGINTWMASQYIQERKNGRNVTLLSATPFTNKPLEYYSILSLVANNTLREKGFFNVNTFFETFMEADNEMEIDATGDVKFKSNVKRFKNNTLFQSLLAEYIDIKGADDNPNLKRPERYNKEFSVNQNQLTKDQYALLNNNLDTTEDGAILTHILNARLTAISPYLSPFNADKKFTIDEFIENSPKLDLTIKLIAQNLTDKPEAGQIIYSELAVNEFPKIKEYLTNHSILKDSQIGIITGKTTKAKRIQIQDDYNAGKIKLIIGSSAIQEGMNLQTNSTDLYLLTLPYNFTSLRQVEGRIWRQGNEFPNVRINYMLTNDSIDVFMLQKLQFKQARYMEAMQKGADVIDISDIDTNELKTALITDPVTRAKIETKLIGNRLEKEKQKYIADNAFVMRKNEDLVKAQENYSKVKSNHERYLKYAEEGGVNGSYWQKEADKHLKLVESAQVSLDDTINTLEKNGVDVSAIKEKMEFTNRKVIEIENKLSNLIELQDQLTEKFKKEKVEDAFENSVNHYLKQRMAENKTFFTSNFNPNVIINKPKEIAEKKIKSFRR